MSRSVSLSSTTVGGSDGGSVGPVVAGEEEGSILGTGEGESVGIGDGSTERSPETRTDEVEARDAEAEDHGEPATVVAAARECGSTEIADEKGKPEAAPKTRPREARAGHITRPPD